MVAGGSTTQGEDAAYARSLGTPDASIKTSPADLRVRSTPTLVLVNQRGEILKAWEGVGPPDKQAAIARAIDAALAR